MHVSSTEYISIAQHSTAAVQCYNSTRQQQPNTKTIQRIQACVEGVQSRWCVRSGVIPVDSGLVTTPDTYRRVSYKSASCCIDRKYELWCF